MLIQHLIVVRVSCSVSLPPKMPYRNTTHPPPSLLGIGGVKSATHLRTFGISPRSTASRNFFSSSSRGCGNPSGTQHPPTDLGAEEAWLTPDDTWHNLKRQVSRSHIRTCRCGEGEIVYAELQINKK